MEKDFVAFYKKRHFISASLATMLADILNRDALLSFADARVFERGADYFDKKLVVSMMMVGEKISARVRGTREYRVKFWEEDGRLAYDCTCPMGREGDFCKHCVATGMAWLAENESVAGGNTNKRSNSVADIRDYLGSQDPSALMDLILQWAERDETLQEQLRLMMADTGNNTDTLRTFKKTIDRAVRTGGFVHYYEMPGYVDGFEKVVDSIAGLLKKSRATTVVDLTEYAIGRIGEALEEIDDSDGDVGGILQRLQDLHHTACVAAKPDPEPLARRLFRLELDGEWDEFYGAAKTYSDLLGERGLKLYRELAEAEWKRVPELRPGASERESWGKRFKITNIMETLAELSGDVEERVAIKARDLSHAYNFLQIAEIYRRAKRHDKALEWAERGVKAFPQRTDERLRDFLAGEYLRRKRVGEALGLIWAQFVELPCLDTYKKLHRYAKPRGQWPHFRERALDCLRKDIQREHMETKGLHRLFAKGPDHSRLARIFLWEKDIEAAWREARAGTCDTDLWVTLAGLRGKEHPEDAIAVYKNLIDPTVIRGNNDAYEEAAGLLKKIQALSVRLGQEAGFRAYLATVRATHKPKRNFIKMISQIDG